MVYSFLFNIFTAEVQEALGDVGQRRGKTCLKKAVLCCDDFLENKFSPLFSLYFSSMARMFQGTWFHVFP